MTQAVKTNAADLVFSTATFHWIKDHPALFAGIFRALRAGGRLPAINVADSGFGASQILPLIVQGLYAESGSLIITEQPVIELELNTFHLYHRSRIMRPWTFVILNVEVR